MPDHPPTPEYYDSPYQTVPNLQTECWQSQAGDLAESWSSAELRAASLGGNSGFHQLHHGAPGEHPAAHTAIPDSKPVIQAAALAGYSGEYKGVYDPRTNLPQATNK